MSELVAAQSLRSGLRSASTTNDILPRLRTKFGERSISHAGPAAWNALLRKLRSAATFYSFKRQPKNTILTLFLTLSFMYAQTFKCTAVLYLTG